jgi:hypothetical protein
MTTIAPTFLGARDGYRWYQSAQPSLGELLDRVPSLVVGRYVAVTSYDSGPLRLGEDEHRIGWTSSEAVAYSPHIANPREIPTDGYDEWYVFRRTTSLERPEVFVNYGRFGLQSPGPFLDRLDPTWDSSLAREQDDWLATCQRRFWNQLARLQPETYLAEGDNLFCVTRNEKAFESLSLKRSGWQVELCEFLPSTLPGTQGRGEGGWGSGGRELGVLMVPSPGAPQSDCLVRTI